MHFSIVKINPPDAPPAHGFDDAIFPLFYALRRLGYRIEILLNRVNPASRNIIFGSCMSPRPTGRMLPPGSIVFNLEQINRESKWCNANYLTHLGDYQVWDYSPANVSDLRDIGIKATHVPLGYVPEMTRLGSDITPQTDLLFYGLITERRQQLLDALLKRGIKLLATQEAFGNLRDSLLAGSRLVLNLHNYTPARLEVVRLGYVWANQRPVLSEREAGTEVPEHLEEACFFAAADELPDMAAKLLKDEHLLGQQAEKGFRAYSSRPMEEDLARIVGRRGFKSGGLASPVENQSEKAPTTDKADSVNNKDWQTAQDEAAARNSRQNSAPPEWLITGDIRVS
ncbi:hypothetical protein LJC48_02575 [Desulfovibrio sp. OttesenSCG-928-C06]|nr:hypothetical protein [Desulfovibrio sp. OttesenSCG-928-C06]